MKVFMLSYPPPRGFSVDFRHFSQRHIFNQIYRYFEYGIFFLRNFRLSLFKNNGAPIAEVPDLLKKKKKKKKKNSDAPEARSRFRK